MMPSMLGSVSHDAKMIKMTKNQDQDQNEKQHEFLSHVMPLEPASTSCDANDIINGTTAFVKSR